MTNPLSGLVRFSDDVNDLSLRLERESVESNTSDYINDIIYRLKGEIVKVDTSNNVNDISFRLEGETVKAATNRVLKIGDTYILFELKELIRSFGLRWNFISSRSKNYVSCYRVSCKSSYKNSLVHSI